jgi:hypothetical protein
MTPSEATGRGVTRLQPDVAPQLRLNLLANRFPEYTSGRSHGYRALTGVQCESAPDAVPRADTCVTELDRGTGGGSG